MSRKSEGKKSFKLYNDYMQHFGIMTDEDAGQCIKAIFRFVNGEPEQDIESGLTGMVLMAFSFVKAQLERDAAAYDDICEVNRKNGSKGGRPKKDAEKPKKPNGFSENQPVSEKIKKTGEDIDTDKEKDTDKKQRTKKDYGAGFEEFWSEYPRKVKKANAYKCYCQRKAAGYSEHELLVAAKNYSFICKKKHTEEEYIMHPSTFLSASTPFEDYIPKRDSEEKPNDTVDEKMRSGANPFL